MKIKIILVFVFFISIFGYGQNNPTFEDIVDKLFSEYKADTVSQVNEIVFQKKDIGWNILVINLESNDTINELFWDNDRKMFNKLSLPLKTNSLIDEDAKHTFVKKSISSKYNNLLYYGYIGWDKDIITSCESKKTLTDFELFSLGYAYSNYANNLLNNNFEFSDTKINFNLPISKNAMTKNQLQLYIEIEKKAINCFFELYKRNPNFQTLPGQIGIKYFNEIASLFLNLKIYQNDEIALNEIQSFEVYSENFKLYAKSMLDSCEKNAILFTVGDNDTFPLIMYQALNNYRKDVLIVNTSLLQDKRYAIIMSNQFIEKNGYKLSIKNELIKDDISEVLIIANTSDDTISIKKLNSILESSDNMYQSINRNYKIITSKKFSYSENSKKLFWEIEKQALYRSDLIILDIIANNIGKRPIYFADNNVVDAYLGLSDYLQFEGLMYKLVFTKGNCINYNIGFVNTIKIEENCLKMYQLKKTTTSNLTIEERQLGMIYRGIYDRLASYYISENQFEKAKLALEKCFDLYPNNLCYYSCDMLSIVESLYKLKNLNKAKEVENQILQNIKDKKDNYCFLSDFEKNRKYEALKMQLDYLKSEYESK